MTDHDDQGPEWPSEASERRGLLSRCLRKGRQRAPKENWGECSRKRSHEYKGPKEGISLGCSRNQKKASAVKV